MLLITCPHCGPRDETEFTYGGEAGVPYPQDPEALSDEEWGEYLFVRANPRGPLAERWCHTSGCRRWFDVVRDTVTQDLGEDSVFAGENGAERRSRGAGRDEAAP